MATFHLIQEGENREWVRVDADAAVVRDLRENKVFWPDAAVTILETAEAEDWHHLDWRKAGLGTNNASAWGWLNRDGKFFGCSSTDHDRIARAIIGKEVRELEQTGWVRVYANDWFCTRRLSAEQRNWLSRREYDLTEDR